jgi:AcrR family transcriptional regulator
MADLALSRRSGRIPAADIAAHDAALVDAAGRLFREHGYGGTSIDMIAREAQASPKTIYARYGGKLGLFTAVVEAMVARPLAVWDALDAERDPGAVLAEAADRFLGIVLSPDVLAIERAIIAEAPRLPDLARTFYARGPRRGLNRLATYLTDQDRRGRLRIDDGRAAAEVFIALIEGESVRRALFLGERLSARARRAWLKEPIAVFMRAYGAG